MPRKKINKAQAIREMLQEMPDGRNTDIIAALKKKRINVSPAQVSNLRTKGQKFGSKKGEGQIDLTTLLGAKEFVDHAGGIEQARAALDTLSKLK